MHHSSRSWEMSLLYVFSWNFTWFLQREPTKVQNFKLAIAQVKFHQICILIGSFCWKYIKFQLKKYKGVCLIILKSGANFEEKPMFCSKTDKTFEIPIQALKTLKYLHFDCSLLLKVYNVWPKKVQRSYISWHWRVMQNLKKNWLVVWKMTWGIWQIFIRTLESVRYFHGILLPKVESTR